MSSPVYSRLSASLGEELCSNEERFQDLFCVVKIFLHLDRREVWRDEV